jgi:hypothetical protein
MFCIAAIIIYWKIYIPNSKAFSPSDIFLILVIWVLYFVCHTFSCIYDCILLTCTFFPSMLICIFCYTVFFTVLASALLLFGHTSVNKMNWMIIISHKSLTLPCWLEVIIYFQVMSRVIPQQKSVLSPTALPECGVI